MNPPDAPKAPRELLALLDEPTRPAILINEPDADSPAPDVPEEPCRYTGRARWATGAGSHQGYRREDNQDAVLTSPHLIAIADGVGGGPAGGIASAMALRVIDLALREPGDVAAALRTAVGQASAALYGAGLVAKDIQGMATTLDAVVLGPPIEGVAEVRGAHVGDAAVWLVRPERAPRLLTRPHRAVNGALTHAVGGGTLHAYCDLWSARLWVGDRLVLTTDGFHSRLERDVVAGLLSRIRDVPADEAVDELVRAALQSGGHDNVSAVIAELVPVGRPGRPSRRAAQVRRLISRRP